MTHRIRHALQEPVFKDKLSGTIEADETYVGGKTRGHGRHFMGNKVPVVSLVERGGRVRSQVMRRVTGKNLKEVLKSNVEPSATIMTDDFRAYRRFRIASIRESFGKRIRSRRCSHKRSRGIFLAAKARRGRDFPPYQ